MQTWILSGKLDGHKGTKTIERKPTKAESEEEVSEADRKLHERIAAEVKSKLEAKGKSTEGVETFEEFYGLLQSESVMLQKKYQPQLRKGIKITVDLVNQVQQDKKDGDVDVELKIAPNDKKKKLSITPDLDLNKEENNSDSLDDNIDTEIGKVVEFNVDGHDHKIWIEEQGGSVEVMMASKATPVEDKIKVWGKQIETLDKDDENFTKVTSLYNLVVQCYNSTNVKAIDLAKKAAKAEAEQEKKRSLIGNERNLKKGKFTSKDNDRRKVVIDREHLDNLKTKLEEVNYYVERDEIALKEAIKRLLLLLGDEGKVKVGDEEIELKTLTEEDKARISEYYDIAIVGVGSAAARWLYTNTKSYKKGIVIGETGGWNSRGQTTTSHTKPLVSPSTPTEEEQSKSGMIDENGDIIFERADDHVKDIESLVEKSGFKRLKESSNSIHKKGEWSLINYGTKKHTIAARKVVLATGAGPENEVARDVENEEDSELHYKKVVTLDQFMNEVEGLKPEELEKRKKLFKKREVLIFGGNAAWDAIHTAEKLGFIVHARSRSGPRPLLDGSKNTESKVLYDEMEKDKKKKQENIAGMYEGHKLSGGRVEISFTGGEKITVDQFVTALGPLPKQIPTKDKEAGPVAILGGPSKIKKLLQPIYDLGKSYSDEVFETVLGLESEDGLLEVIGAAAFRVGDYVNDTQAAIDRFNKLKEEEKKIDELPKSKEKSQKLTNLEAMLDTFSSIRNKFNNSRKAHAKSVAVSEQLGALNSTIEAINRINARIKDKTGETTKRVKEQIEKDGINMQVDNWSSIQQYIIIKWDNLSKKKNVANNQKQTLAKKAAKMIVKARSREGQYAHGITWEEAMTIIENIV